MSQHNFAKISRGEQWKLVFCGISKGKVTNTFSAIAYSEHTKKLCSFFSHLSFATAWVGAGHKTTQKNGICPQKVRLSHIFCDDSRQGRTRWTYSTKYQEKDGVKEGDKVFIRNYFKQTLGSLILLLGNFPQPHIVVGMNIFLQYKTIRMV